MSWASPTHGLSRTRRVSGDTLACAARYPPNLAPLLPPHEAHARLPSCRYWSGRELTFPRELFPEKTTVVKKSSLVKKGKRAPGANS